MIQTKPKKPPRSLARLDRERRALNITLEQIAAEASKTSTRGSVGIPNVSNVLAGRHKSANVVTTLKRMIMAAKSRAA